MTAGISTGRLAAAFAAVYLIWGSSYLAIQIGLEFMPPLTLAAVRSLMGGGFLFLWGWMTGHGRLGSNKWPRAVVIGGLLFLAGHGGPFWALARFPQA